MKKFAWMLILIMALVLVVGCGQAAEEPAQEVTEEPEEEVAEEPEEVEEEIAWPEETISLVVPYAPGGIVDVFARGLAQYLGEELGTTVIVENMEGGGGSVGNAHVQTSNPDGYTFAVTNNAELTIGELIRDLPYTTEDFTYIDTYFIEPAPIMAKAGNYESLEDMINAAKEGTVTFATIGTGGYYHLQALMLEQAADVTFNIVPYTGGAPIGTDLQGGHIDIGIAGMGFGLNQRAQGTLDVLAQVGDMPFPGTEGEIPLVKDVYPDFKGTHQYFGIVGPKDIPDAIAKKMEAAYQAVLANPDFQAWASENNMSLQSIGSDAFYQAMVDYRANYAAMEDIIERVKSEIE